jgi:predicted transcriptional regulator
MEITVPTSLSEITCLQLHKITEASRIIDNDTLLKMTIVSIVTNIPLDKVVKFSMSDINEISDGILNILHQKPEIEVFKINGVDFGFIPNLETIPGNEYLDLEMYLETDIFKAMAVMYRPIKRKTKELYVIEKYKGADKYEELMLQAPASAYIAGKFFFLNLLMDLLSVTPAYLLKNLTSSEVALLEKNGVGISQLTNSLQEIGSDLKKLLQN